MYSISHNKSRYGVRFALFIPIHSGYTPASRSKQYGNDGRTSKQSSHQFLPLTNDISRAFSGQAKFPQYHEKTLCFNRTSKDKRPPGTYLMQKNPVLSMFTQTDPVKKNLIPKKQSIIGRQISRTRFDISVYRVAVRRPSD